MSQPLSLTELANKYGSDKGNAVRFRHNMHGERRVERVQVFQAAIRGDGILNEQLEIAIGLSAKAGEGIPQMG